MINTIHTNKVIGQMIVQNKKLYRTAAHFGNLNEFKTPPLPGVFCPFIDDGSDVVESWFIVTVCVGFVCGACSVVQY